MGWFCCDAPLWFLNCFELQNDAICLATLHRSLSFIDRFSAHFYGIYLAQTGVMLSALWLLHQRVKEQRWFRKFKDSCPLSEQEYKFKKEKLRRFRHVREYSEINQR